MPLDPEQVRAQFPALAQRIHGAPLVYLDNAATVQKPAVVIEEMTRAYVELCANVNRGAHTLGARATAAHEGARESVRSLLGARAADEIVLTSGCTAAINLVAFAWGDAHVGPGDELMVSALEHHSNWLPWQELCLRRGARLVEIPIDPRGELDLEAYSNRLSGRTRLVAVTQLSNALGTLPPIEEIVRRAHAAGALVLVDGAQAVARKAVSVEALGCDFYAFSAHKLYGPYGLGALYARRELLAAMPPLLTGGGMVEHVGLERSSYAAAPARFEPGTPNVAAAAGLTRAIEFVRGLGLDAIERHERELIAYARGALEAQPGVRLLGPLDSLGVVSFALEGVHPHDVATVLDRHGIAVRAGHHCAQPLMERLGENGTVRASFAVYNTRADVDALIGALRHAREVLAS